MLMEKKADNTATDRLGRTPWELAVNRRSAGRRGTVEALGFASLLPTLSMNMVIQYLSSEGLEATKIIQGLLQPLEVENTDLQFALRAPLVERLEVIIAEAREHTPTLSEPSTWLIKANDLDIQKIAASNWFYVRQTKAPMLL